MLRKMVVLSMVVGLGAFAQGCGNDCDAAADQIQAKFDECGVTVPSGDDGGDEEAECTEADGTAALCVADCTDAVPCENLDTDTSNDDADAAAAYLECLGGC
ncbi:MAG: hypothetical protein HOW73_15925 [Polyangiaceae bacterium]|nr:hypothetical protein [Polyangiaceae bacterium]